MPRPGGVIAPIGSAQRQYLLMSLSAGARGAMTLEPAHGV
ncbi:hypothetical protein XCR_0256 [Xanthomonas campestris pv. raphani 756C]|nr:hypothetical protein XCR_0256 [Xanthomonas campestris pv. raphani 756C]